MTPDEFEIVYRRAFSRLTAEECEVIEAVVAGAQVNYALLYMAACTLIGGVGGWCLRALLG